MKKHIIKQTLSVIAAIIMFSGCTKEDTTFSGQDNYLASLSINKDGIIYKATVSGNTITVSVPENVDMVGATGECEISELSTILPDPKKIIDWDSVTEFSVESYKGNTRNYKFDIIRTNTIQRGNVTLLTQADVNAFALKKVSVIEGHLIIGGTTMGDETDTIKNLNALSGLKEINGNLVIKNSYAGNDLNGLSNLIKADNIYIGTTSTELNGEDSITIALPNLATVGEVVINHPKAKSISIPDLTKAYCLYVNSKSIKNIELPSLEQISGDITIQSSNTASTSTANASLKKIELSSLKKVEGSFTLQGLIAVESVNLSTLKYTGNNFYIGYLSALANIEIPSMEEVLGTMSFMSLIACKAISAPKLSQVGSFISSGVNSSRITSEFNLPVLEKINKDFEISYAAPENLSLNTLKKVGGQFKLSYIGTLKTFALPMLTSCTKFYMTNVNYIESFDISKISKLGSMEIVSSYVLASIKMPQEVGNITLNGGSKATLVPVLDGLENVTGTFTILSYKLSSVSIPNVKKIVTYTQSSGTNLLTLSFSDLEEIENLTLSSLTTLTTLTAPKLKRIGTLDFNSMWMLSIIDFSSLKEITTAMKIWGSTYTDGASNCKITGLNGFINVNKIGSVSIKWCGSLINYSGLKNAIASLSADKWSVLECLYNPTFLDMQEGRYTK